MAEKFLMKGNEALAEAAIRSGCRHFFGYPITPQTEVAAYMAKRMPKIGGTYLQAESEIAAINMVLGCASTGARAMTSSSSPGISLKGEGISYIIGSDLPCLIVNVMRGGPGLGGIQPSQADYWQATKAPGHGDGQVLVFAPSSVHEIVDMVAKAYDLAETYRMPAMLLADGYKPVAEMPAPDEMKKQKKYYVENENQITAVYVETYVEPDYRSKRAAEYPDFREYLDAVVKTSSEDETMAAAGKTQLQTYCRLCLEIKQKYPKE